MMGRFDWVQTCFAMPFPPHTCVSSPTDEIMSKYRPIAPKPTLSLNIVEFGSASTHTHRGNTSAKSGQRRRRASDSSKPPSPRVVKRARPPTEENIGGTRAHRSKLAYPFHGSFSAEESTFEKGLDKSHGGFEGLDMKAMIKSTGEVGVENPATNMDVLPVPTMAAETQYDCGYVVFPIVDAFQQEEQKNLVTLPLLPQTPDSVLCCTASIATSGSCQREEIPLRLFGRDFSHEDVGSSKSPNRRKCVPIVGLSFL